MLEGIYEPANNSFHMSKSLLGSYQLVDILQCNQGCKMHKLDLTWLNLNVPYKRDYREQGSDLKSWYDIVSQPVGIR